MDLLILVITCIANILLGAIVLMRDHRSWTARVFAVIIFFILAWIITNYITNHPTASLLLNDWANRMAFLSGLCVLASGLVFSYIFPVRRKVSRAEIVAVEVVVLTVLALSVTNLVAGEVSYRSDGSLNFSVGPLLWLYVCTFTGMLLLTSRNLLVHKGGVDSRTRKQSLAVFVGFIVTALLALFLNVVLPILGGDWHSTRFGPLVTVFLVAVMAYSIVRHQLFDIKLAVMRTVAYSCALLTLSGVYYLAAYVLSLVIFGGQSQNSVRVSGFDVGIALGLAFIFQPVKSFFDKITNNIFYRDSYDTDTLYGEMSKLLASTTDLRVLLERAAVKISDTIKAEQGMFFVYHSGDLNHYVSAGTKKRSYLALADAHALNRHVESNGDDVIVAELLDKDHHLRRMMTGYKLSIILPLRRAGVIVGYLCLGNHKGSGFTSKDVRVLETLRDELVVAVQNALAVQEIKEMNATLEQKIDIATKELRTSNAKLRHIDEVKDEFMSMASHQLRTPLTSVKGYLSMVLEGDAGKVNPQQKQLLEEAFNSSERMVRLISDFLNVSRLQTGKFLIEKAPIDLAAVASQEVASLRVLAAGHGMKIDFVQPGEPCMINADEGKVRQVIMNFIDNAIYYSKPDSTITVSLVRDRNEYDLVVADTGIGVPKAEQDRLFHKFFRATNARSQRPDGTGVGLFLARKVITAHGGKLIFTSTEGKGSRFGFSLPVFNKK